MQTDEPNTVLHVHIHSIALALPSMHWPVHTAPTPHTSSQQAASVVRADNATQTMNRIARRMLE